MIGDKIAGGDRGDEMLQRDRRKGDEGRRVERGRCYE